MSIQMQIVKLTIAPAIAVVSVLIPMLLFPNSPGFWIVGGMIGVQLIIGLLIVWPPEFITKFFNKHLWNDPPSK
ncbi:MAG: hypothetical protein ABIH67_00475 [Candidatus Uhrbacteria bacterium]